MAGRILIVDDVATNRIVLKVKLATACYDVLQAQNGKHALEIARSERPDLILLDVLMPDMDGITVCRKLKSNPETAHIPVIIVTALDDTESRISALEAGADEFLSKPIDELTLLARVRSLLRACETNDELKLRDSTCRALGFAEFSTDFSHPSRIGLIAAKTSLAAQWKTELSQHLGDGIEVISQENALNWDEDQPPPDIFVISGDLKRLDEGLRLLSEIRSRPISRYSSVIMVLRQTARQQAAIALDLGANDLMVEGFSARELALRIKTQAKRKAQSDRLRNVMQDGLKLAAIDPLTGLYNRRYAFSHLPRIAERAQETGRSFAVMMLDIDRFKRINDQFGHAAGDAVLAEISRCLQDNLRGVDLVARIGGEEFLVVLPDTDIEEAQIAAERIRRTVKATTIEFGDIPERIGVTISIGVIMGGGQGEKACSDIDRLMRGADTALYGSKTDGRNQVTFSHIAA